MTRNNPMAGACATAVGLQVAADRLGAARDEIDAQLGRGAMRFERLREMQQSVQIAGIVPSSTARVEVPEVNDALRRASPRRRRGVASNPPALPGAG